MICYSCKKIGECPIFRTLNKKSKDFCINECKDYDEVSKYIYRNIAYNDNLMHLIYDYFTNQLQDCTEEKAKEAIVNAMWNLE